MTLTLDIRLLVFDWDGTLMDSEAQIVTCMHSAIRDLQLEPSSDDQVRNIIGLGLWEAIDGLYPDRDRRFHKTFTARYRHYWLQSNGSSQLFAGARETLHELKVRGYQLAVATGKGRVGLAKVLQETRLEGMFHATRCADESGSKPHPAMLYDIMSELAIEPGCTLMVGDTEYDLEMASKAGTHSLGVACGVHSNERLLQHQPLAILNDIRELTGWLEQHIMGAE
ncbi:MAG: HAD-IA family hydrolase [Gammaproteobacteria bacterium]